MTATYQFGPRRAASITVDNWGNIYDMYANSIAFDQQIKLSKGVYLPNGTPFYLPLGTFYISNPKSVFSPSTRTATLDLVDKWAFLDGSLFGKIAGIYMLTTGTNLYTATQQLLLTSRQDVNSTPLDTIAPFFTSYYIGKTYEIDGQTYNMLDCPYTAKIGDNYAAVLEEINTMLVSMMGYNCRGQFCIESANGEIEDNLREIMWDFDANGRTLFSIDATALKTDVYNHVVITGGVLNGRIAKGEALDTSPHNPYNANRIGRKTYAEEQSKYYSDYQCDELAKYYLNKFKRLKHEVTIECAPIPHLQENSLFTLRRAEVDKWQVPYLINSFTMPLGCTQSMTITATELEVGKDARVFEPQLVSYPLGVYQLGSL